MTTYRTIRTVHSFAVFILISACGGNSSDTSESPFIDPDSNPPVLDNSGNNNPADENALDNDTVSSDTEPTPAPDPTDTTDSQPEPTLTEPTPTQEAEPTAPPVTTEPPSAMEQEIVGGGFTNVTAFCEDAGLRIQSSVEIGMTPEQVRSLVGKPLEIGVSGTFWDYGRGVFVPEVRFNPTLVDGALSPGVVTEWDTNTDSCDNDEDPFIEAANALAQEPPGEDQTNNVLPCVEVGIRVQAYIELGMTPDEVRTLIGKPVEISVSGTLWDYGQGVFVPEIRFSSQLINGALAPGVVTEIDSNTSSCE